MLSKYDGQADMGKVTKIKKDDLTMMYLTLPPICIIHTSNAKSYTNQCNG